MEEMIILLLFVSYLCDLSIIKGVFPLSLGDANEYYSAESGTRLCIHTKIFLESSNLEKHLRLTRRAHITPRRPEQMAGTPRNSLDTSYHLLLQLSELLWRVSWLLFERRTR